MENISNYSITLVLSYLIQLNDQYTELRANKIYRNSLRYFNQFDHIKFFLRKHSAINAKRKSYKHKIYANFLVLLNFENNFLICKFS